jgi:hypothetical protein
MPQFPSYGPLGQFSGVPLENTTMVGQHGIGNGIYAGGTQLQTPTYAGAQLQNFGGLDAGLWGMGNAGIKAQAGSIGSAQGNAQSLENMGKNIRGEFSGNQAYANQALQNAFDPQKALYNQYLGQVTDQTNSQEALRGIANTPYGAAVTGNTLGQFNTGWNAQQIQNENIGAQTAEGLQGQQLAAQTAGGQMIGEAGQLNLGAASQTLQGFGLQSQDAQNALQDLVNMFSAQSVSLKG